MQCRNPVCFGVHALQNFHPVAFNLYGVQRELMCRMWLIDHQILLSKTVLQCTDLLWRPQLAWHGTV